MGRRRHDEEPGLSRETILAEAARLFKRNGYRKTRLEEVAQVLGVSPRTVELDWRMARAWLSRELSHADA